MKNLGHFDDKAVELFKANFSESTEFSEKDEAYDFTRCQRPDGSVYGTSGQCRKGTPTSDKAPEKKAAKGKVTQKSDKPSAKTKAPSDLKAKATELRELNKVAKAADKKAETADKAWRKAGMPKGEQQKEVRRLDREAKAANREADKSGRELVRMKKAAEKAETKGRLSKVKVMTREDLKKASDSDLKSQMKAANDAFFNSKGLTRTQEKALSQAHKDAKAELDSRG